MPIASHKVALTTGANKGIGYEIARQNCRSGVTVLVGACDRAARGQAAVRLSDSGFAAEKKRMTADAGVRL